MKFPHLYRVVDKSNFREELQYALVKQDYTYATDAHVLVRHNTSSLFDDVFISHIRKEGIPLNYQILKAICLSSIVSVDLKDTLYSPGIITLKSKDDYRYPNLEFCLKFASMMKFPDFEKVLFKEENAKPLDKIRIKPELLHNAAMAMDPELPILGLYFQDITKSILIKPKLDSDYYGAVGVIMPCMWE